MVPLWRSWIATAAIVLILNANASGVVGSDFCYSDDDGCGPSSDHWDGACHTGHSQSPIDIPPLRVTDERTELRLNSYKGTSFRLQNNGHTVAVDFMGLGPSAQPFPFPDAASVNNANQGIRNYTFSSAHFHWGKTDNNGSEHCIIEENSLRTCYAMELHLVHYMSNYTNQSEAISSGNPNALAVLGIWIKSYRPIIPSGLTPSLVSPLTPIVKHLNEVSTVGYSSTVKEPLDLSQLLKDVPAVFSYKGSLTTPGCNEQVNWFVSRKPARIPTSEVKLFRSSLMDAHDKTMNINHRPVQPINGRTVYLSAVTQSSNN